MKKSRQSKLHKMASISLSFAIMLQLFTGNLNIVFANDEGNTTPEVAATQEEIATQEESATPEAVEITETQTVSAQSIKTGFALGETLDVQINGVANETTGTINLGDITPIEYDGYRFINATVGNVEISTLGKYEGELYYAIQHEDSALLLGSNTVNFNYAKNLDDLNVAYNYDETAFSVEGPTTITEGQNMFFRINQFDNAYKLISVTANGNKLSLDQDGYYTVNDVRTNVTIEVVSELISEFNITVNDRYTNGYKFEVSKKIKKGVNEWIEIGVIDTNVDTFNSIVVNNEYINIATAGASQSATRETTLADGTQISVRNKSTYDGWQMVHKYTYTIYVRNANSDLNFVPSVYKKTNISFLKIEGVTVYHWNGAELIEVPVGAMMNKQNSTDVFFVATKPGYGASLSMGGAGTKIIEKISDVNNLENVQGDYNAAKDAAIEKGCNYVFYYSDKSINNRQVTLKSVLIDYSVKYDLNGGVSATDIEDNNKYTIENGSNVIKINKNTPKKDNSTFIGWKLETSNVSYSANRDLVVNKMLIKHSNNDTFNFVAQWIDDENQVTASYVIKHFFEGEKDVYVEDEAMRSTIWGAPVNEKAIAIPKQNLVDHLFDATVNENVLNGLVSFDNKLELKVYYSLRPIAPETTPIPPVVNPIPTPPVVVDEVVLPIVVPTVSPEVTPVIDEEVVDEEETPEQGVEESEIVEEENTPLVFGNSRWALINLIFAVLAILLAGLILLSKNKSKKTTQSTIYKVISSLVAIVSVVVFALTQSMDGSMILVDSWTMLMGAFVAIQFAIVLIAKETKLASNKFAN